MGASTSKKTPKAKAPKATKQRKPTREKIPADEVCVFAFRLSKKDRDQIHQAAGSGRASAFVVAATMAAVAGDVEAFQRVVASRSTK